VANDSRRRKAYAPNYPMIGDADLSIAKVGMLPAARAVMHRSAPRR